MANPTTNFGWQMPQNTDLVKDLPADFEVFGQAVDTDLADLKGGTTGQVLSKATNTDLDFTWATPVSSPLTTKGDLFTYSTADARLGVGTNGYYLTADSAETTGLKWSPPPSGGKVLQVVSMSTTTQVTTTSTTWVNISGYDLTITPSSVSSKILVIFNPQISGGGVVTQIYNGFGIARNSTLIMSTNNFNTQGAAALGGGYTWQAHQGAMIYLDSPNTTSATVYRGQFQDSTGVGQTVTFNQSSSQSTIILMEIGA